jgi:hypothetical protein
VNEGPELPSKPAPADKLALRTYGYFEATRSDDALELLAANQDAFCLAYYIAARASWRDGFNRHGCAFGEAFLGAGATESYGMGKGDKGESRYRRAKATRAKVAIAEQRHFYPRAILRSSK